MNNFFKETILSSTGATDLYEIELIQNLWSNYGKILRLGLHGSEIKSVVVKHVLLPNNSKHPRGWNTDKSHNRKIKSYQVEMAWYREFGAMCGTGCPIPKCLALETEGDEVLMVLEDLNSVGYPDRRSSISLDELFECITWLANFHVTFMGIKPKNLWEVGTYWHLDTRPDELEVLSDKKLKDAASLIDDKLNSCKFKTLVHGDAKLANFCFSEDGKQVAMVDFQYVGGGCGIKDLIYFIGSCLYEEDCERLENDILKHYFRALKKESIKQSKTYNIEEVEKEWRSLYKVAWTDFHRFLKGWSPGHWKINSYSERLSREVLGELWN